MVKFRNGDSIVDRITPSIENSKTALVDNEIGFGFTELVVSRERKESQIINLYENDSIIFTNLTFIFVCLHILP